MGTRKRRANDERDERPPPELFVRQLLRHEVRQEILRLLAERPGMNQHQLSQELGVNHNVVVYHVKRMQRFGLLETRPGVRQRETLCFRPEDVSLWDVESTRFLLGRAPALGVAQFLAANPGAEANAISQALGLTVPTVRRHLNTLEEEELVQRFRVDRKVLYHAEPELVNALAALLPGGDPTGDASSPSHDTQA